MYCLKKLSVECMGTFFLSFMIFFVPEPTLIGLILMAMLYIGKDISGGHFNPAVSLAMFLKKVITLADMLYYALAQIIGSTLAGILFYSVNKQLNPEMAPVLSFKVIDKLNFITLLTIESLLTFVVCLVVLTVIVSYKFKNNYIYGLVIGGTVAALSPIASLNPAIAFGKMMINVISKGLAAFGDDSVFGAALGFTGIPVSLIVNMCGPLLGAGLAVVVYRWLNDDYAV